MYVCINYHDKNRKKTNAYTYLVIRRLSRKLGEPCRRGIDGERDLLEAELLEIEREDRLETLLDDLDELEKLLPRLCLELRKKSDLTCVCLARLFL